jgi:NADPH:quinone reductase-like Zn-dependent oxidoreductase
LVNPDDNKGHRRAEPPADECQVPGWDVAGVAVSIGDAVTLSRLGDRVRCADAKDRSVANAEFGLAGERIVATPCSFVLDLKRLEPVNAHQTAWRLPKPRRGGRGALSLTPLELIDLLAAPGPPASVHPPIS